MTKNPSHSFTEGYDTNPDGTVDEERREEARLHSEAVNKKPEPSIQDVRPATQDLYYLRSIARNLTEFQKLADDAADFEGWGIGNEVLADNIEWLADYITQTEKSANSYPDNQATIARLVEALRECREYFDQRADADQPSGALSPIPNEEMTLLVQVDAALNTIKGSEKDG